MKIIPPAEVLDPARVTSVPWACCDACPAEARVKAYVFATMPSGGSLAYCAHHGRESMVELHLQGAIVVDLTHVLHDHT